MSLGGMLFHRLWVGLVCIGMAGLGQVAHATQSLNPGFDLHPDLNWTPNPPSGSSSPTPTGQQAKGELVALASNDWDTVGSGEFIRLEGTPVLNDLGQVAYKGSVHLPDIEDGGSVSGIFVRNADGSTDTAVISWPILQSDGSTFTLPMDVRHWSINNQGQVAFTAYKRFESPTYSEHHGVFVATPSANTIRQVATHDQLGIDYYADFSMPPRIDDLGNVVFSVDSAPNQALYFAHASGHIEVVAEQGEILPGLDTPTGGPYLLQYYGQSVVFKASQYRPDAGYTSHLFRRLPDGTVERITSDGDLAPDGIETIATSNTYGQQISPSGDRVIVFPESWLSGNSTNPPMVIDGTSPPIWLIPPSEMPVSDHIRTVEPLSINDNGQIACFFGASWESLIILEADGSTTTIAEIGQLTPDGDSTFQDFRNVEMNNQGQVLFSALHNRHGDSLRGIYFYDPSLGLQRIASEGDELFGSTIDWIAVYADWAMGEYADVLNESGQLVYGFELADGRSGYALYTPVPEPMVCFTLLTAGTVLSRHLRVCSRPTGA